jgi:cysteine-rich repeat protein
LLGSAYVCAAVSIALVLGLSGPARAQARCGDGTIEFPETCDDGNIVGGDGCSSTCTVEAGFTCNRASPTSCKKLDTDRDGVPDLQDNCPYTANLDQKDSGGINTTTPDGIGDACQCGDVSGDGIVNTADSTVLARSLVGQSPYFSVGAMPGAAKCDLNGDGVCSTVDLSILKRGLVGLSPGINQVCPAATSAVGGGLGNGQPNPTPCPPATSPTIPDLNAEGWLGGDGGASVLMPDGSSVWVFGDSFIGQPNATARTNIFASNSIGISACNGSSWEAMDHFWGQLATAPEPFFNPTLLSPNFDWPQEVFYSAPNLYAVLQRGMRTPGVGLGFTLTGTDLAIVSNSDPVGAWTNPGEWTQQIVPINTSSGASGAWPNSATIQSSDGFVYIYTSLSPNGFITPMAIVRAPLNDLSNIGSDLEYLSQDGTWHQGLVASDAQHVMDDGFSGMSVTWHAAQNEWIAVYIPGFSNQIVIRTAPNFLGPWSAPQAKYPIPEMTSGGAGYDPNNFCYGAFEHIEWATPTSMVVTYDCNNSNLTTLANDMNIYHPVPVTISLP